MKAGKEARAVAVLTEATGSGPLGPWVPAPEVVAPVGSAAPVT